MMEGNHESKIQLNKLRLRRFNVIIDDKKNILMKKS
jgi:hypothetical protein